MNKLEKFIDDYIKMIKKDPKRYIDDYKRLKDEEVRKGYLYHEKPIPFAYQPFFINDDMEEDFKYIVKTTNSIIRKVVDAYLEDENIRKLFSFDTRLERLILHDPLYDIPVPIGRYDIFYRGRDDFKFCEINTDGSSAMFEDYAISDLLMSSLSIEELKKNIAISSYELFDSWVQKVIKLYRNIRGENPKNMIIMDFLELGTPDEFEKFKEHFKKASIDCEIADVRDVRYEDGKLIYNGKKIDLVYRRMVTSEMMRRYDEVGDFIEGYLNDAFVTIGSFRSQIPHNKIFFEILRRDEIKRLLSESENEFVEAHIPFTARFAGDEKFLEEIVKSKDKFIFKPTDLSAARGVYVGRELSEDEFRIKAGKDINTDYIYQEFVEPKTIEFLELVDDDFKVIERGNMVGLFSYMEEFSGVYTRMGKEDIIGSIREYVAAPGFKY